MFLSLFISINASSMDGRLPMMSITSISTLQVISFDTHIKEVDKKYIIRRLWSQTYSVTRFHLYIIDIQLEKEKNIVASERSSIKYRTIYTQNNLVTMSDHEREKI